MKIIIETPYGKVESLEMDDSVGETQEALQKTLGNEDLQCLTIQTEDGPVILASECAKRSMARIIK